MAPGVPNERKMQLRKTVSARLELMSEEQRKLESKAVYDKVINHPWYQTASRIALYMSTDTEVDTQGLIQHIQERGARAFVPQYAGGHMKMLRVLRDDEEHMLVTRHGIAQHSDGQVREEALDNGGLDLIITPGLAFSRSGDRLGHGGGYYDRYLARVQELGLRPKVIALGFKCQVVEEVPVEPTDQKIDEIITSD